MKKYLLLISLLLSISFAQQPLAELAPPDSILSLTMSYQEKLGSSIKDDLKALNWNEATDTIHKLVKILISSNKFSELNDMLFALESKDMFFAEMEAQCPALAEQFKSMHHNRQHSGIEMIETISLGSFAPMPAVTLIARASNEENHIKGLYDALISCALESGVELPRLEQDGTPIYILNDGEDLPFVVSYHNNLFIASTNPDDVRAVIRLANGSGEASLADSYVYQQAQMQLGSYKNSLRVSLDFAQIANSVDNLAGMFARNSEDRAALDRLLSALYTLGGNVSQISAVAEGIISENLVTVNPDGGDLALLKLLNCQHCQVLSAPILAPADSIAINMTYVPWRESFDYLQSVLNDVASIYGENADLKELSLAFLGLDLDTALFNWLGSEIHSYTLEPISPNLATIFNGPAQATIIPVASVEQAKQGLAELRDVLLPIMQNLMAEAGSNAGFLESFGPLEGLPEFPQSEFNEFSVREYSYKDITINRVQNGINSDFAYAFIGNHLVLATPTAALEKIIDTAESGLNIYNNATFRLAKQSVPTGSSSFSYSEIDSNLNGLADIIDLFIQPLAFGINQFLKLKITDDAYPMAQIDDTYDPIDEAVFEADIGGIIVYDTISNPATVVDNLSETDIDNYGYFSHYYELSGLNTGDLMSVRLSSTAFDTQLWLVDSNRAVYILGNDDVDDTSTDSEISFTVDDSSNYWLEVSSFNGDGVGEYQLDLNYYDATTVIDVVIEEDFIDSDYLEADLTDMTAVAITVPGEISANLEDGQIDNYGNTTAFYSLSGFVAGDIVKVSLSSPDFDTQLWLTDTTNSIYLADNDDFTAATTDSGLAFEAQTDVTYWLEITSYDNVTSGNYSLNLEFGEASDLVEASFEGIDGELLEADLENMQASSINVSETAFGNLEETEVDNYGYLTDFYEISGVNAGDEITVSLQSDDFDASLWLVDVTNNVYLDDNDDFDETTLDAGISFVAKEGITYWVEVTSSSASDISVGNYQLSVDYSNSADMANDPMHDMMNDQMHDMMMDFDTELTAEDIPSFEELLNLFDLLPNAIRVLADHISTDVAYTKNTSDSIYSREFTRIDW